jgi:uncharacterized protein
LRQGLVLGLLVLAGRAFAAEPVIPEPTGYVNDTAGVMDERSRAKLESFLDQLHKKTGAYFAVLTVATTAPLDPREYKTQVFHRWKIANQEPFEGLLMLVAIEERRVDFETGYGLEGTLTDGFEADVVRRSVAPRFRERDYAGGITAGVLACAARIAKEKGVTLEWNGSELRYRRGRDEPPFWATLMFGFFLVAMFLAVANAWRRGQGFGAALGPMIAGRRRRGSGWNDWGGWGGGFGGGGGGGGGGSFGGFGGGGGFGSGGGGGGGSW